jgi:hypothetical protein
MATQSYANHRQYVPLFHYILLPVLFLTMVGSVVNLYHSLGDHERQYSASLIVVMSVAMLVFAVQARLFALRAQDRAIRAEEGLRHFVLVGKLPDPRLTIGQIIALRFASDNEFPILARRAADESLAPEAIKKSIKSWRPDFYRV